MKTHGTRRGVKGRSSTQPPERGFTALPWSFQPNLGIRVRPSSPFLPFRYWERKGFLQHGGQKWLLALLFHWEQKVITARGSTEKTTINSNTYLSAKTATTLLSLEYFDYSVSEKQLGKLRYLIKCQIITQKPVLKFYSINLLILISSQVLSRVRILFPQTLEKIGPAPVDFKSEAKPTEVKTRTKLHRIFIYMNWMKLIAKLYFFKISGCYIKIVLTSLHTYG